jgi:hypothetical protein
MICAQTPKLTTRFAITDRAIDVGQEATSAAPLSVARSSVDRASGISRLLDRSQRSAHDAALMRPLTRSVGEHVSRLADERVRANCVCSGSPPAMVEARLHGRCAYDLRALESAGTYSFNTGSQFGHHAHLPGALWQVPARRLDATRRGAHHRRAVNRTVFDMMDSGMMRCGQCVVASRGRWPQTASAAAYSTPGRDFHRKFRRGLGPQLRRRFAPATGFQGANLITIEAKHK